ncbi:AMP-binding protein, partial [Flavobacterium sp.]
FQLKIARKLIFSKWKEGLGGNLDLMVSGSAALQPRLTRVFAAAEIPVMEGYGLTETSPVIAVNDQRNKGFKIGTVGKPIRNLEVKIAQDGEILIKGPNVMLGYFNDPEKTAEALQDGYFHTGDIGEIDGEGFLKITDRKKEMFKTSGGKYIAPQMIENAMKQSRFIEQIMVIGEGEKMPAAFIQPNFEFVKEWAKIHRITLGSTDKEISENKDVIKRIDEEVESINKKFGHWEQIKRFELTPDVWSIDGGQLTPTLKLKRKIIKEIYKDLYAKIYGNN